MAKRFAEHNGLNLTKVNDDILEMWREKNVFWRSSVRAVRSLYSLRGLPRPTVIRVSITCWRVLLRILSTAIRR